MQGDQEKKYLREEYKSRINKVQDYIDSNLSAELSVIELAKVANFSPYHFHRIFSAFMGEPLFQYIQRIRLEKSASLLCANPKKTIVEIALECGFSNQASFARAFKKLFNVSASQWRVHPILESSKKCKTESKSGKIDRNNRKDLSGDISYNDLVRKKSNWREDSMKNLNFNVEVKEIPDLHVVYIRHTGPYKEDPALFAKLWNKLMKWAGARGLIKFPETKLLTVFHDNPEVTDENNLRVSVCLTAPENTKVDGEIGSMTITGGKYAIGHFQIAVTEYQDAWNSLYGVWLPESGYQPADGSCFEQYLNNPDEHPEHLSLVDIYLPVKPL